MTHSRHGVRLVYLLAVAATAAVLTSACGKDDASPPASPTSPTPSSSPPPTVEARRCPGTGVVGNVAGVPEIHIVGLQPGSSSVRGTAANFDASTTKIVLWAKTDQWYVQPFIATPFTSACSDGTWSNTTHPWTRLVALLVNASYVPGAIRQTHPSADPGVLAWDEYPSRQADRTLDFGGFRWLVKNADLAGPGPNYFSDNEDNVVVAGDGLHLRITPRSGHWYCAEVFTDRSLGYGTYTFQVSGADRLDPHAVFAGFTYEQANREIDIERSRDLAAPFNTQFVIQPYTRSGNIVRFDATGSDESWRFTWQPSAIQFAVWRGFDPDPSAGTLVRTWTYTGPDIPPAGGERVRFNLWLNNGQSPGSPQEVIVRAFRFNR